MMRKDPIDIDYFSDLLCVWACLAQARADELRSAFGAEVRMHYRYFNLLVLSGILPSSPPGSGRYIQ